VNGVLGGDAGGADQVRVPEGDFPGFDRCPFGNPEKWAEADKEGSAYQVTMQAMGPHGWFSKRLWFATPDAGSVCRACFSVTRPDEVHYKCLWAIKRGLDREPSTRHLFVAASADVATTWIAEWSAATIRDGPEAEQAWLEEHCDVSREVLAAAKAKVGFVDPFAKPGGLPAQAGGPDGGRAQVGVPLSTLDIRTTRFLLEVLRTLASELMVLGDVPEAEERGRRARAAFAGVHASVATLVESFPLFQRALQSLQGPDRAWVATPADYMTRLAYLHISQLVTATQGAVDAATSATLPGTTKGGEGGAGTLSVLKPTTLGVDLSEFGEGQVVTKEGVSYVRLPGSTDGVQLVKRKDTEGAGAGHLLCLRLGIAPGVAENRSVWAHLRTAARAVTSGVGTAWTDLERQAVEKAVQEGLVPVLTGALTGQLDGAAQRWAAAFASYAAFVQRFHGGGDPLRRQIGRLAADSSVSRALQKHGARLVDSVWTTVSKEYSTDVTCLLAEVPYMAGGGDFNAWPGLEAHWPDFHARFTGGLLTAVAHAGAVEALRGDVIGTRVRASETHRDGGGGEGAAGGSSGAKPGGVKRPAEEALGGICKFDLTPAGCYKAGCKYAHPQRGPANSKRR